jgi:hypothetical protein
VILLSYQLKSTKEKKIMSNLKNRNGKLNKTLNQWVEKYDKEMAISEDLRNMEFTTQCSIMIKALKKTIKRREESDIAVYVDTSMNIPKYLIDELEKIANAKIQKKEDSHFQLEDGSWCTNNEGWKLVLKAQKDLN